MSRLGVQTTVLALLLAAAGASANDSTGFQSTTGIVPTKSADIRMVSEDLRIGLDEVTVAYVFRNEGPTPIETEVIFPLPALDLSKGLTAPNWEFPVADDDFLGFKLWIDDKPVPVERQRRATLDGRDVTDVVAAAGGFALAPWVHGAYDELTAKMPPANLKRLRDAGLVREGEDSDTPAWTLRAAYHWRMTFPPGVEVRVRHAYKPFVGNALMGSPEALDGRRVYGRLVEEPASLADRYCLDDGTKRAFVAAWKRAARETPQPFDVSEISYVLTTGANWKGPIGTFRLTIDKGSPENFVSLCWDGLVKTGPTTFSSTKTDLTPSRELDLMILRRTRRDG